MNKVKRVVIDLDESPGQIQFNVPKVPEFTVLKARDVSSKSSTQSMPRKSKLGSIDEISENDLDLTINI